MKEAHHEWIRSMAEAARKTGLPSVERKYRNMLKGLEGPDELEDI